MTASSAPPARAAFSTRARRGACADTATGTVSASQIAPDARRALRVEVDHHRAAAGELVRNGEADCDGGLSGTALLRHQRYG